MRLKSFEYPAILVRQGAGAPPLALLSASAVEIDRWVGIPQKTRMLEGETIGFQRDFSEVRVAQIARFYSEPRNVIHNPLLCAVRKPLGVEVIFKPAFDVPSGDAAAELGTLQVTLPDRSATPLLALFREAREVLEERVAGLAGRADPDDLIAKLRSLADGTAGAALATEDADAEDDEEEAELSTVRTLAEEALFEDSHVFEFWAELRAREVLLSRLGEQFAGNEFIGFGREALEAYLRPIVLVDGQHRLLGALRAARDAVDGSEDALVEAAEKLSAGVPRDEVRDALLVERARRLPISLLMDPSPGEHVFQFVVVNQKATPVRPALLATCPSSGFLGQLAA